MATLPKANSGLGKFSSVNSLSELQVFVPSATHPVHEKPETTLTISEDIFGDLLSFHSFWFSLLKKACFCAYDDEITRLRNCCPALVSLFDHVYQCHLNNHPFAHNGAGKMLLCELLRIVNTRWLKGWHIMLSTTVSNTDWCHFGPRKGKQPHNKRKRSHSSQKVPKAKRTKQQGTKIPEVTEYPMPPSPRTTDSCSSQPQESKAPESSHPEASRSSQPQSSVSSQPKDLIIRPANSQPQRPKSRSGAGDMHGKRIYIGKVV